MLQQIGICPILSWVMVFLERKEILGFFYINLQILEA